MFEPQGFDEITKNIIKFIYKIHELIYTIFYCSPCHPKIASCQNENVPPSLSLLPNCLMTSLLNFCQFQDDIVIGSYASKLFHKVWFKLFQSRHWMPINKR